MTTVHARPITDYLETWGGVTSTVALDPACSLFHTPAIDGVIAYREGHHCVAVIGDVMSAPHDQLPLVEAFKKFCDEQDKGIVYINISEPFAHTLFDKKYIHFAAAMGKDIVLNPAIDPRLAPGRHAYTLRKNHNAATRQGLTVHEYKENEMHLHDEMERVKLLWLGNRKGPQATLASQIDLFTYRSNKRHFYVLKDDEVIGVLMLNKVRQGWVIYLAMLNPTAPAITSDILFLHALDILREEGASFLSMGIPSATCELMLTKNKFHAWIIEQSYPIAAKFLNLKNKERYWEKFNPQKNHVFIGSSRDKIGLNEIITVMKVFNSTFQ